MKHILAIWHKAGKGKSETIRQIANQFLLLYPTATPVFPATIIVPAKGDFRLVVEVLIKGVLTRVAFESQGDPRTNLEARLTELAVGFNCVILFCTCRTKGETVEAIENTANNYDFNTIWTSTYQVIGLTNQAIANQQKGMHVIQLMQALSII